MNVFKTLSLICLSLSSVLLSCSFFEQRSAHHRIEEELRVLLQEAQQHRQKALNTTERELQLKEIGATLQLYLQLERRLRDEGRQPSPELDAAIASSYALLQQPGWALYYYHQALSQTPGAHQIREQIDKIEGELSIPPSSFTSSLFDYQYLLGITAVLWTASFLVASCSIWLQSQRLKQYGIGCALIGLLPLLIALYVRHAAPLYGIIVESTPLYRMPNSYSPSQHARILLEGMHVEVLGTSSDPTWLMVRVKGKQSLKSANGEPLPLYIPSHSIRLIEETL